MIEYDRENLTRIEMYCFHPISFSISHKRGGVPSGNGGNSVNEGTVWK